MGIRIISDDNGAVIYCSTTMRAFGPVFKDHYEAEDFLQWLPRDARHYLDGELSNKYADFLAEIEAAENTPDPEQVAESRGES